MRNQAFPSGLINELQFYVYLYINPLDGKIFYVGKGQGNRVFAHLQDESESEKVQTIKRIRASGQVPRIQLLAHHLPDEESAHRIECAAIDLLGIDYLTNNMRGHGATDQGRIDVDVLLERFSHGNPGSSGRRVGGPDFEAVLNEYLKVAPSGFGQIGRREDNRRSDTWAAVIGVNWPSTWRDVFYEFQIHNEYGQQIGVEIHDERKIKAPSDAIVKTIDAFEPDLSRQFPNRVRPFWKYKYPGRGVAILYDREEDKTTIAQTMRILIELTHAKLEAALRDVMR